MKILPFRRKREPESLPVIETKTLSEGEFVLKGWLAEAGLDSLANERRSGWHEVDGQRVLNINSDQETTIDWQEVNRGEPVAFMVFAGGVEAKFPSAIIYQEADTDGRLHIDPESDQPIFKAITPIQKEDGSYFYEPRKIRDSQLFTLAPETLSKDEVFQNIIPVKNLSWDYNKDAPYAQVRIDNFGNPHIRNCVPPTLLQIVPLHLAQVKDLESRFLRKQEKLAKAA